MQACKHISLLSTEQAAQDLRGCSLDQDRVARCDHQIFDLGAGIDPGIVLVIVIFGSSFALYCNISASVL